MLKIKKNCLDAYKAKIRATVIQGHSASGEGERGNILNTTFFFRAWRREGDWAK